LLCVCIPVILCNVGCEKCEDQKLAEEADTRNALVAMGTEDDNSEASVEGMQLNVTSFHSTRSHN